MKKIRMLGALVGDIIGSVYERRNTKSTDFELFTRRSRFTDDTMMTLAVARWLLEDEGHTERYLIECMQELGRRYPRAGYGRAFKRWLNEENPQPYYSYGNGSAMRVSPVGLYAKTLDEALSLATITASVSHNHPEGVKGAQAIAACVLLCKQGKSKEEIREYVEKTFGYDLHRRVAEIRPSYRFDVSCQGSVPEAIIAFLEGNSFEEVIRLAVSLGGDSDTIGAMAGSIAACMYPIPEWIAERCINMLPEDLKEIEEDFKRFLHVRTISCTQISRQNYKAYVNLDAVAFSYAHGGAQGVGGEIIVITKNVKMYAMNYVYGDMEIEMCDEVCPPLKDCIFGFFDVEETPVGWKGVRLGAGNFLVLAEPLYYQLRRQMFKMPSYVLYGKWIDLVTSYLEENEEE